MEDSKTIGVWMLEIAELLEPVREGVAGYRADCVARGFSDASAEEMAVDYHAHLLCLVMAKVEKVTS